MIPPSFLFDCAPVPVIRHDRANWFGAGFLSFVVIVAAAAAFYFVFVQILVPLVLFVPSSVVSALTYAVLIVPTYLMHRRYAFHSAAEHARALPRYALVQILSLALIAGFTYLAYGSVGFTHPPAALLVIGLTAGVNFTVLKLYAFASR